MGDTVLARTGVTNPLGKQDNDIGRLKVPDVVFAAIAEVTSKTGLTHLQVVNEVLGMWSLGRKGYDSMQRARADVLEGKWKERGGLGGG